VAADPGGELVEVIDDNGVVVDITTRAEMRRLNLPHRCTYISVVDQHDQIVVHRRADWKDINPGYWDIAFGGVCSVGEQWLDSARRELVEEAGISGAELIDLGSAWYRDDTTVTLGRIYVARWDGPISCDDGEVVAVDKVELGSIDSWLNTHQICPDSAAIVETVTTYLS